MKLKKIEFKLDKIFSGKQTIDFKNKKICVIGENASGKSSLLYAINASNNGTRSFRYNYFKVEDSQYKYYVPLDSYLKQLLGLKHDVIEVTMKNSNYNIEFYSPYFEEVVVNYMSVLDEKYNDILKTIGKIDKMFKVFCSKHNIDIENYFVVLSHYINRDYGHKKDILKVIDSVGEGYLKSNNDFYNLYGIREVDFLVGKSSTVIYREKHELLTKFFSEFRKTGTPKHSEFINKFQNKNISLLRQINSQISEYDQVIDKFNKIFGTHSEVYNLFVKSMTRNVLLLDHNSTASHHDRVFELALLGISETVYNQIVTWYKEIISDLTKNHDLYINLVNLRVLDSKFHNLSIDDFETKTSDFVEFANHYQENKNLILRTLMNVIKSGQILRDYSEDNEKYFNKYFYNIKKEFLLEMVEEYMNDVYPVYLTPNFNGISIRYNQNRRTVNVILNDIVNLDDISSGTIWTLKLLLMKKLVGENDILLIDEPALFLHASAQKVILKQILNLDCYVIYTTHSPNMVPVNLQTVMLYQIFKENENSHIVHLDSEVEEKIIEVFGLRYLQNFIIDYTKEALFLPNSEKKFDNARVEANVMNDITILPGELSKEVMGKLIDFLNIIKVNLTLVVREVKNDYEYIKNNNNNVKVYKLSEIKELMNKNKGKDLSEILKEDRK